MEVETIRHRDFVTYSLGKLVSISFPLHPDARGFLPFTFDPEILRRRELRRALLERQAEALKAGAHA